jgi:3-deoxy-D-arabino-heptulosonate 7-phosphate (DAHP) synthase class II
VQSSAHVVEYRDMIARIKEALEFMDVCGAAADRTAPAFLWAVIFYFCSPWPLPSLPFASCTRALTHVANLRSVNFFSSHEVLARSHHLLTPPLPPQGLHLAYEEQLTRRVGPSYFNLGAHFLWIGDRTRQLDGAHVEYFRGVENPLGVKVGPTLPPDELVKLILTLCPDVNNQPGKVSLITRYGADKVEVRERGGVAQCVCFLNSAWGGGVLC